MRITDKVGTSHFTFHMIGFQIVIYHIINLFIGHVISNTEAHTELMSDLLLSPQSKGGAVKQHRH